MAYIVVLIMPMLAAACPEGPGCHTADYQALLQTWTGGRDLSSQEEFQNTSNLIQDPDDAVDELEKAVADAKANLDLSKDDSEQIQKAMKGVADGIKAFEKCKSGNCDPVETSKGLLDAGAAILSAAGLIGPMGQTVAVFGSLVLSFFTKPTASAKPLTIQDIQSVVKEEVDKALAASKADYLLNEKLPKAKTGYTNTLKNLLDLSSKNAEDAVSMKERYMPNWVQSLQGSCQDMVGIHGLIFGADYGEGTDLRSKTVEDLGFSDTCPCGDDVFYWEDDQCRENTVPNWGSFASALVAYRAVSKLTPLILATATAVFANNGWGTDDMDFTQFKQAMETCLEIDMQLDSTMAQIGAFTINDDLAIAPYAPVCDTDKCNYATAYQSWVDDLESDPSWMHTDIHAPFIDLDACMSALEEVKAKYPSISYWLSEWWAGGETGKGQGTIENVCSENDAMRFNLYDVSLAQAKQKFDETYGTIYLRKQACVPQVLRDIVKDKNNWKDNSGMDNVNLS